MFLRCGQLIHVFWCGLMPRGLWVCWHAHTLMCSGEASQWFWEGAQLPLLAASELLAAPPAIERIRATFSIPLAFHPPLHRSKAPSLVAPPNPLPILPHARVDPVALPCSPHSGSHPPSHSESSPLSSTHVPIPCLHVHPIRLLSPPFFRVSHTGWIQWPCPVAQVAQA